MSHWQPAPANDYPAVFSRRPLLARAWHGAAVAVLALAAASALAAGVHHIAQRGRAFSVSKIIIAPGDTVQFTNDDEFFHQIYVDSSRMSFDSDEQPPGQTIDVKFPVRGTFPVRCHIHPKMLLTVDVQ